MKSPVTSAVLATPELTEAFAERFGRQLRGGETIELIGDVGAGKTTFVRGLARGVGSADRVSSPTFTVSQIYESSSLSLHHYDFYRISDYEIISRELQEVVSDGRNVVVVEWAEDVRPAMPGDRVVIKITVMDEHTRRLDCTFPARFNYLEPKL